MLPERYTIENLFRGIRNPSLLLKEFKRLPQSALHRFNRLYFRSKYGTGVDVMNEDWDNLIILDACRYDAFSDINSISGELNSKISQGSTSHEFIERNFVGRKLHDTVYITANPFIGHIEPDVFHAVIDLLDKWNDEHQTVMPDSVVKSVNEVYEEYTDKRLIIHFMQPHQPYLGNKAEKIRAKMTTKVEQRGWNNALREPDSETSKSLEGIKMWEAPKHPELEITEEDIWGAYKETLDIVLKHVNELLDIVEGKTVITADHGELIGDKSPLFRRNRQYGHPGNTWVQELRMVPWFVPNSEKRRNIKSDPPRRFDNVNEDNIDKKLEALGYKQ